MRESSFLSHVGPATRAHRVTAGQVAPALHLLYQDELQLLQQPVPLVLDDASYQVSYS